MSASIARSSSGERMKGLLARLSARDREPEPRALSEFAGIGPLWEVETGLTFLF